MTTRVVHVLGAGDLNVALDDSDRRNGVSLAEKFGFRLSDFCELDVQQQLQWLAEPRDGRPAAIVGLLEHLATAGADSPIHLYLVATAQQPQHAGDTLRVAQQFVLLAEHAHLDRWSPRAPVRASVVPVDELSLQVVRDEVCAALRATDEHDEVLVNMGPGSVSVFTGAAAGVIDAGHPLRIIDTSSVGETHQSMPIRWDAPDETQFLAALRAYRTLALRDRARADLWVQLLRLFLLDWTLGPAPQPEERRVVFECALSERLDLDDSAAAFLGRPVLEAQHARLFPRRTDEDFEALMRGTLDRPSKEERTFRRQHLDGYGTFVSADHDRLPTMRRVTRACAALAFDEDLRRRLLVDSGVNAPPTWRRDGLAIMALGNRPASAARAMLDASLQHLQEQVAGHARALLVYSAETEPTALELIGAAPMTCTGIKVDLLHGTRSVQHVASRVSTVLRKRFAVVGRVAVCVGPGTKPVNIGCLLAAGQWATRAAAHCELVALLHEGDHTIVEPDENQVVFRVGNDKLLNSICGELAENERLGT